MVKQSYFMLDGPKSCDLFPVGKLPRQRYEGTAKPVPPELQPFTRNRLVWLIDIVDGYGFKRENRWIVYSTKREAERVLSRIALTEKE